MSAVSGETPERTNERVVAARDLIVSAIVVLLGENGEPIVRSDVAYQLLTAVQTLQSGD